MTDCLFCKIVAGDIPSDKVYEDDLIYAFKDIYPKADVHILVIPKVHITSLEELSSEHNDLMAHMMLKLKDIASEQGLTTGFRTIINTGPGGGQEVGHLHIHIMGGPNLPGFK
jgi:histidine triad (HIT) family protein